MIDPQQNPFAVSASAIRADQGFASMAPADRKKLDAVIKDANQFWMAIILCFFCSAVGLVLIGPWYSVRLLQWNRLGNTYPELRQSAPMSGTIFQQYQAARWKLLTGLIFGATIAMMMIGTMAFIG